MFEVNRHGIRFVFIQVGRIGKFDFQALLLTFVASVGLLAVSSTVRPRPCVPAPALYFLSRTSMHLATSASVYLKQAALVLALAVRKDDGV